MATVTGLTASRMLEIEAATVVTAEINGSNHLVFTTYGGTQIDVGEIITSIPISSDILQGIVELATDAETITGVDSLKAVTPLGLSALTSTDTRKGLVELATNAETVAGTDDVRVVTPAGLGSVLTSLVATDSVKGLVELATNSETTTGTDTTRAVTPASLASLIATATVRGLVEFATDIEAATGTDTTRAVTPANVKPLLDAKQPLDADLTAVATLVPANDDIVQRKSGVWSNRTMAQLATDLVATGEFPDVRLYNGSAYVDADNAYIYVGTVDPGSVANGSVWFDTTP